jgi:hypothetical protein
MAEAYKKVGRGGAGNFYSKKDVQDVAKATEAVSLMCSAAFNPPGREG